MRKMIQVKGRGMEVFQVGRMVWSEDNGLVLPLLFSRWVTSGKSPSWRFNFLIFLWRRAVVVMIMVVADMVALVGGGGLGGRGRDK